jgi:glutamate-1-semialdehyde 2,1-aminomutase
MQGLLGLKPALTCMGKVAAGGMPGGIVCGHAELMSVLCRGSQAAGGSQRKVLHQGTFTGNPLTAGAALVTIDEVVNKELCSHATQMGHLARSRLNELFVSLGVGWKAYGRFSAFHILPRETPEDVDRLPWEVFASRPIPALQSLKIALNLEGVDIGSRGTGFLSGIHRPEDVDCLIGAFGKAVMRLRREAILR